ncbi:AP2/ERF domain-containing protein, partial [Haematococcus lacustris]
MGRIYYTNCYSTPEEAARAVDRYIYKIKGPDAPTNFPLDAAQRAELDGLSLDDVEAQFRKLGARPGLARATC